MYHFTDQTWNRREEAQREQKQQREKMALSYGREEQWKQMKGPEVKEVFKTSLCAPQGAPVATCVGDVGSNTSWLPPCSHQHLAEGTIHSLKFMLGWRHIKKYIYNKKNWANIKLHFLWWKRTKLYMHTNVLLEFGLQKNQKKDK